MTLTFKDPNGREWELRAHRVDYGDSRFAEPADLLSALGQLSTGSDGPTREDIQSAYDAAYLASEQAGERYPHDDAKRSLYNAGRAEGLALGEQKQAARVRELEQRVADLKFALGDGAGWFDRYKRAESELVATKGKLAEAMKRHPSGAAVRAERDAFRADLEQMRDLLPNDWQTQTELGGQVMVELKKQRDEAARLDEKLAEVERERDAATEVMLRANRSWQKRFDSLGDECGKLRSELASARRVVEAATVMRDRYTDLPIDARLSFVDTAMGRAFTGLRDALASAGTDADRTEATKCSPFCVNPWCPNRCWPPAATEPPRPEAGESGPVCGWHPSNDDGFRGGPDCGAPATHLSCLPLDCTPTCAVHKCRCAKPLKSEEPKPEPRCTYWRPGRERRCGLATDGADLCPAHLMLSTCKFGLNVRPEETNVDIPRRDRIDQMTPAELAIRAAVEAVERVGAHPLLTDAVNLLHEAQGRVADYVDTTAEPKPDPQPRCNAPEPSASVARSEVESGGKP